MRLPPMPPPPQTPPPPLQACTAAAGDEAASLRARLAADEADATTLRSDLKMDVKHVCLDMENMQGFHLDMATVECANECLSPISCM